MSSTTSEVFDRKVANTVSHSGFRTQLFTVAGGSYASSATYGSNATLLNEYSAVSVQDKSKATVRQQDRDVDYHLKLTLDISQADPGFPTDEELRLRTLQPLAMGESAAYLKRLPLNARAYGLPLFLDVEIIDPATGAPPAGFPSIAGIGQLQARFLHGSELALVVSDITAGPPPTVTPLTAGDLAPLFGAGAAAPGSELLISVRGTYRGQNHSL